jgi:hypothetical protein
LGLWKVSEAHNSQPPSSSHPLTHFLYFLCVVADWIASTDTSDEGWLASYYGVLLKNGITTMQKAQAIIEESGDLREWQIPKLAAKSLYVSMLEYQLDDDACAEGSARATADTEELRIELTEDDAI